MASGSFGSSCGLPSRGVQSSTGGSRACISDSTLMGCSRHSSIELRFPAAGHAEPFSNGSGSIEP